MAKGHRTPLLDGLYHQYLVDQDNDVFGQLVAQRHTVGTLERLAVCGNRMTRRAAVLAIGILGDYRSNSSLGKALHDTDRGVRMLAESGIRYLWCRDGAPSQREILNSVCELNTSRHFELAREAATRLIEQTPSLAEAWNQRALSLFSLGRYADSIRDCSQALELNPYHFGAASGMGQCHLQLHNRTLALDCFRRALKLNPNLEGVRAHVLYLQRTLKSQE